MKTTSMRARALAFALLATTSLAAVDSASAETKLENRLPDRFVLSPGGVDMRSGRYAYSETDLTIGAQGQSGGLALTRTIPNYAGNHANPFGNFSHNWDMMLMESRVDLNTGGSVGNDYRMNVHFGGRALTFESRQDSIGYEYKSDGPAATLTFSGDRASASVVYTFTAPDGTILTFRPMGSYDCADQLWGPGPRRCAFVSEMIEADGTRFSFDYGYDGGAAGNRARLRQVTSSRGYALLLEGNGSRVTKACVLNLTQSGPPADGLCPQGLPTSSYSYDANGKLTAATDPTGAVSSFTYEPVDGRPAMGFIKPGESAPWLTNFIQLDNDEEDNPKEVTVSQRFADGQSYSYSYDTGPSTNNKPDPAIAGGFYRDAAGRETIVRFGFPVLPGTGYEPACRQAPCSVEEPNQFLDYTYQQTPGPVEVTDPLGRTTTADYCDPALMAGAPPQQVHRCAVGPVASFTDPEGIKTLLEYDGYRNITKVTQNPKPGQEALAPIVTRSTYACINAKSCTKPTSVTDAKGKTTNYTYASAHGGILTETGPAVTIGSGSTATLVRPQTRYSYEQRYAWYKDGTGAIVQAPSPVWLLTQTSTCQTSAGNDNPEAPCATSGDEVRVTYDYGPTTGANNLNLRGTLTTSAGISVRTCYGYDQNGRRISETGAGANLASCQ